MRHRCTQETHTETCSICHAVFCPACLSFHQHQKPASADHRRAANEQPHDILQYASAPPWPNTFAQTNLSCSLFACDEAADHTFRVAKTRTLWDSGRVDDTRVLCLALFLKPAPNRCNSSLNISEFIAA